MLRATTAASRLPVLLDCDTGIDDALALTYLACRREVELLGVVSTGGNVPVDVVHRNNRVLCRLLGLGGVPVARGADAPLVEPPMYADDTHGPGGLGYARLPESPRTASDGGADSEARGSGLGRPGGGDPDGWDGARLWVELARAHPGQLVGIVLGPHTNLARALTLEPELPRLLRRLHIMGGAIHHRGNTGPTSEWNIAVDPEAAQQVLAAFASAPQLPVLGPLDATEQIVFTEQTVASVAALGDHPVVPILGDALRWYVDFHEADGFGRICHVHDPFVTAHAVESHLDSAGAQRFASTSPLAVDVELVGTLTRGQTVGDPLGRWGRPPTVEVLRDVDADAVIEHLLEVLGHLG
ncbi:nucleoside hydrolase [Brachybacterium sp. EF45031]|uniref:nucleoside hydrolase n=1 Tax=Brachybacterium sillae TaxID=2810536 RepID=UPI00217D1C78|nr:nucleoside hydrolase [Brachybacterium sillae]MCS6710768.1 nucleoside hydrolase [Brachybacterium sillae]